MARVSIDILGIGELKWNRADKFNGDDHYIHYWGQKFLRRNGVAFIVNNRVWKAVLQFNWAPYYKTHAYVEKVGKITILVRYDLNQIPYDYTVEVKNRFKGLDLLDTVLEVLWTEVCNSLQEAVTETIPKKKK